VVIYLTRLADVCSIDLGAAFSAKMLKNAIKYPADRARGSSAKYTAYTTATSAATAGTTAAAAATVTPVPTPPLSPGSSSSSSSNSDSAGTAADATAAISSTQPALAAAAAAAAVRNNSSISANTSGSSVAPECEHPAAGQYHLAEQQHTNTTSTSSGSGSSSSVWLLLKQPWALHCAAAVLLLSVGFAAGLKWSACP
jgi:hypothetical protein